MTYKWDATITENYAEKLAEKICAENYIDTDVLDGPQLLELTPVRQVNLFILKELYTNWQAEMAKLESVYFDFKHPEVQSALSDFMNFVSEFIAVRQKELSPLLQKSIFKTIQLGLLPKEFFRDEANYQLQSKLSKQWIEKNKRYFTLNKWVINGLSAASESKQSISAFELDELLDKLSNANKLDEINEILSVLALIVPTPSELIYNEPQPVVAVPKTTKSFFDSLIEEKIVEKIRPAVASPIPEIPQANPVTKAVEEIISTQKVTEKSENKRVNERFENGLQSLNDKANNAGVVTDYHRLSKIESIRKTISINQKFLFINNLFNGNIEAFNDALSEFDALTTFDEALTLVEKRYANQLLWDLQSAEVEEFLDILKRRFI